MKKVLSATAGVILLMVFLTFTGVTYAQTSGTFSFSVTTTSTGGYSPNHLLAIWIENGSASFVKTKIMYASVDNLDHMDTWVTRSGENVVDAVSGSTLSSHGTISFLWNGTDVSGALVQDGQYSTWLEMAWASSLTTGKTVNSFPFTKGASAFHYAPANTANFLSISLDWTPSVPTSIKGEMENQDIIVYPNPSNGLLNISFKHFEKECLIRVISEAGLISYIEKVTDVQAGTKSIDLTRLPYGTYYCTLHFPDRDLVFRVILVK
jgi:hypothetical protein